jgi:hypothetical protein
MNDRRVRRERLLGIRDDRERLIVYVNQIEGVPHRVPILGNYGGDSLANITDFVDA